MVWIRLTAIVALVTALSFTPSRSWAQQTPGTDAQLAEDYDQAFQELFRDPGNLDKSFRFAELAVRRENFEAAISALERMLLVDPDLPRVRLELGVLYFRLGSFEIARSYLQPVLDTPNVPDDVRQRVKTFLTEVNNRLTRSRFSGGLSAGYRFADNANTGPSSTGVLASGVPAELDQQFTNKSDINYFASVQINHFYDFLTQNNDTFETSLTVYGSKQRRQRQLDTVFGELTSGPRHPYLQSWIEGASIRPYVLLGSVFLGDAYYESAWGAGVETTFPWTSALSSTFSLEGKREEFSDDSQRPTASGQTGVETGFRVRSTWTVLSNLQFSNRLELTNQTAQDHSNAFTEYLFGLGVTRLFAWRLLRDDPVALSFTINRQLSDYHDVNADVDPDRKRQDKQWLAGLAATIPLTEKWSFVANGLRTTTASNIPNYRYRASSLSSSLSYRF
ncbi:MAG: tetratricopeptide repeat protein [Alphaproteobacteria bacterium]|nr:tetratricopeptide repeat protein [Alphaproteobacteria bacterium]